MADELEFGDELRDSIERNVFGEMQKLSFDTAGRITLPELLCEQYGITDPKALDLSTAEADPRLSHAPRG